MHPLDSMESLPHNSIPPSEQGELKSPYELVRLAATQRRVQKEVAQNESHTTRQKEFLEEVEAADQAERYRKNRNRRTQVEEE